MRKQLRNISAIALLTLAAACGAATEPEYGDPLSGWGPGTPGAESDIGQGGETGTGGQAGGMGVLTEDAGK